MLTDLSASVAELFYDTQRYLQATEHEILEYKVAEVAPLVLHRNVSSISMTPSSAPNGNLKPEASTETMAVTLTTKPLPIPTIKTNELERNPWVEEKAQEKQLAPTPHEDAPTTIGGKEEMVKVSKWKGKGKAVDSADDGPSTLTPSVTLAARSQVDWVKYEPPRGLRNVQDIKSDIIKQIVTESIDKLKAQIAEEEERRRAAAEAERVRREELDSAKELVINLPETSPKHETEGPNNKSNDSNTHGLLDGISQSVEYAGVSMMARTYGLPLPYAPPKPKKRSWKALLRRFNISDEKGESSHAGASRHKGRLSTSSIEMVEGRKRAASESKSTTSRDSTSIPSVHEETVECVSCLDDVPVKDTIKAPCHSYCRDCFTRLITTTCENEQQWPPKCCLNTIPKETIFSNVDSQLRKKFRDRDVEWSIPISNRIYCHQPDCGQFLPPKKINHAENIVRCSRGHWTCVFCRGARHQGRDCPQDRDLMRTEELAEQEGWRRCIGCHAYVEHKEACQHMTCRCGAQFCYVCGARWRTCACTMDQLTRLKATAAARRRERDVREAREAREAAEAIRLVEDFEREERKKAELLRLEQERLAEERRRRQLEERIRWEGIRRRAVELKFIDLRKKLGSLHKEQMSAVASEHNREETEMNDSAATAMENMKAKHKEDRETLVAETNARFVERECAFTKEYNARVQEERRIEEAYLAQLKAYWAHDDKAERQIEAAMNSLRRKMDKGFAAWKKWMQNELDRCQLQVKEEQAVHLEMLEHAERTLSARSRREEEQFGKRREAELVWVDVVIRERERMLMEMESQEMESGENIEALLVDGVSEDGMGEDDAVVIEGNGLDEDDMHSFRVPGAFT